MQVCDLVTVALCKPEYIHVRDKANTHVQVMLNMLYNLWNVWTLYMYVRKNDDLVYNM